MSGKWDEKIVYKRIKRTDDVGTVFIEVPEVELEQDKHEKMELRTCLIFAKEMMVCNGLVLPKTFEKIDKVLKETV